MTKLLQQFCPVRSIPIPANALDSGSTSVRLPTLCTANALDSGSCFPGQINSHYRKLPKVCTAKAVDSGSASHWGSGGRKRKCGTGVVREETVYGTRGTEGGCDNVQESDNC
eukprot:919805-Rhodomonas_salina.1